MDDQLTLTKEHLMRMILEETIWELRIFMWRMNSGSPNPPPMVMELSDQVLAKLVRAMAVNDSRLKTVRGNLIMAQLEIAGQLEQHAKLLREHSKTLEGIR